MFIRNFLDVMYEGDIELFIADLKFAGMAAFFAVPFVSIIWPMFNMN